MHDSTPYNSKGLDHRYRYSDNVEIPEIEKNEQITKKHVQFGVVCKKDIQNFLKRLRKKIDKLNISDNDKKIRYYIASEYGPITKRPHYHGIIFFDSKQLGSQIKNLIVESWGLFEKEPGKFNKYKFTPFADTFVSTPSFVNIVRFCLIIPESISSKTSFRLALNSPITGFFRL